MQVYLLDKNFDIVSVADQVTRLEVRRRFFSPGHISVKLPPHTIVPDSAYYVYCTDGRLSCGLIERRERLEDASVELAGRMLEALLERRIIKGECVYDGRVDTCVQDAVKNNAVLNRGIPYLEMGLSDSFSEKT